MATNTNPKIQIDDLVRPMTASELAEYEAQQAEHAAQAAAIEAKATARASALAKLAAIGLTQEEIDSL
jgi:hypothetical protein